MRRPAAQFESIAFMAELYVGVCGYSYKPWQGKIGFILRPKANSFLISTRALSCRRDGWNLVPMPGERRGRWDLQAEPSFRYTLRAHRNMAPGAFKG